MPTEKQVAERRRGWDRVRLAAAIRTRPGQTTAELAVMLGDRRFAREATRRRLHELERRGIVERRGLYPMRWYPCPESDDAGR